MASRRDFLGLAGAGFGVAALPGAAPLRADPRHFTIEKIDRTSVRVPFREIVARSMDRELPHWRYSEILEVRLASGARGFGESMLFYTWGRTEDAHVRRALGRNAAELMWDDSLGAGLQIALFDAVARTAGVPVHALLGRKVNAKTPISWWNIDMPPEDMASECREALKQGYLAYKTKGRPWFDVWRQMELSTKGMPPEFRIDMDFNETLLNAEKAIPVLKDLAQYPQAEIFEEPIPPRDVEGGRAIVAATPVKVAIHYGRISGRSAVKEGCCHGFVMGGVPRLVMRAGGFGAEAVIPLGLQLTGTGITAAFSLHLGGVLSHAMWPAINCFQLYEHPLLTEPIKVEKSLAVVPDGHGLGYELDRDAVARYRIEKPARRPDPDRLVVASWPDGRTMYFASGDVNFVLRPAMQGKTPFFERGVTTRLWPDDGSARFRELFDRARGNPVLLKE